MKKLIVPLIALVLIVACAKEKKIPEIIGNEYKTIERGTPIIIRFDAEGNRVSGKVVNNYFGTYEIDGGKISFGPIASTLMMGPEESMKVEQGHLTFLSKVTTFEGDDETLILKTQAGEKKIFKKTETK